jgi:uncharacterized protein involved in outer membrane biogenesis
MKIIKKLFFVIIGLIVLVVGAGFVGLQFVDNAMIEEQVQKATGRTLKIDGEISPQISLSPAVTVTNVTFQNASWGSKPEMAKIGELGVQLELMPLLSGNVKVKYITLKDSEILLEKKNNKWNFAFDKAEKTQEKAQEKSGNEPAKKQTFDVDNIEIANSTLRINQDGNKTKVKLQSFKLSPSGDQLQFGYQGDLNDKLIDVSFLMPRIPQLMESKKFEADKLAVKFDNYNFVGDAKVDLSKAKPTIVANLATDSLTLPAGAKSEAPQDAEPKAGSAPAKNSLDEPLPFDVFNAVNADINLKIGELNKGEIEISDISAPIKISGGVLNISDLKAKFASGEIDGAIKLSSAVTSVRIKGDNLLMSEVLQQTIAFDDFKNGPTELDINLNGNGNTANKIMASLTGHSNIYMKHGVYNKAINTGSLKEFAVLLGGGQKADSTPLNCVLANVDWNGGVGNISAMSVDSNNAYMLASGDIKLNSKKLDMVITPRSKTTGLMNLAVPIAVKGKMSDLSFFPDPKSAITGLGKNFAGTFLPTEIGQTLGVGAEQSPCAGAIASANEPILPLEKLGQQKIDEIKDKAVNSVGKKLKLDDKLKGLF